MTNLLRIAGSFVIVFVAYGTYAVTAVPLIEPSLDPNKRIEVSSDKIKRAEGHADRQMAELAVLFPPGSLQIENPKILQSDRAKLLIGEYEPKEDGHVIKIWPCAIVFLPEDENITPSERLERAVVLEAPEAWLEFDEPFDLGQAKMGQPIGGRLNGKITIRSAGKPDDPDDDLLVLTRDVQLDFQQAQRHIWTRHPVRFRYGPHFGSGRDMHMYLLPGDNVGSKRKNRRGPNIAGLESFELTHLDRLHLRLPRKSMAIGSAPVAPRCGATPSSQPPLAAAAKGATQCEHVPLEITCAGPFRFDAVQRRATFQKKVVVTGLHPDGQHDRLENCSRLTVHFTPRRDRDKSSGDDPIIPSPSKARRPLDLEPCRLEAVGNPVVFRAPSESVDGRGGRLQYDLLSGQIVLEGDEPVFLRRGSDEIEAPHLRYQTPEPGRRLGRVGAEGPGRIRTVLDDQPFEARWNHLLLVRPDGQNQAISLYGAAELLYSRLGHLSAGEIHFRLNEIADPKDSTRFKIEPDRMQADGDVKLSSPKISAAVEQLQVWFVQDENSPGATAELPSASKGDSPIFSPAAPPQKSGQSPGAAAGLPSSEWASSGAPPTPVPGARPTGRLPHGEASEPSLDRHFRVTGRLLQAEIVWHERKADVADLIISDHVELVETHTARPDEKPVTVRGQRIHVKHASKPYATVGIEGNPATFEGRGVSLSGTNINLNQGTNRLRVEKAGVMNLPPIGRDLEGRPTGSNEPLRVHWQDRMEFDGRTARFEGKVRAASRLQQLLTETLEASFDRMIRFAKVDKLDGPSSFRLQELRCQGGVWMESRSFKNGLQESFEQVETQNLVINNASGAVTATGPGWIRSVRHKSAALGEMVGLAGAPSTTQQNPTPTADPSAEDPLMYLHVRFQGGISGNLHRREITFHDQVRAVYGPVESWEATLPEDNPEALGPKGARLGCDKLTVRRMPSPLSDQPSIELEATGSARVEGRDFAALAARMSYNQNKGLMILEGDGWTKATLSRQTRVGGPRDLGVPARQILFWPETKEARFSDVGSLEINQFPSKKSRQ